MKIDKVVVGSSVIVAVSFILIALYLTMGRLTSERQAAFMLPEEVDISMSIIGLVASMGQDQAYSNVLGEQTDSVVVDNKEATIGVVPAFAQYQYEQSLIRGEN